jgi:hypothetical protein
MSVHMQQTEIFIPYVLTQANWVDESVVKSWGSWREAVVWCWDHQRYHQVKKQNDGTQVLFRSHCKQIYELEMHGPHLSRCLKGNSKAPMDLPNDFVAAFESFTGWRGLTQFFNRKAKTTCLEEMQARLAA